ncbi:MAG: hypothetical protein MUF42_16650 [Cytophagaceae bacterium]|jgi:hypothetical protein|nr:hypothetical protein [Cytophagaceae bacterium]
MKTLKIFPALLLMLLVACSGGGNQFAKNWKATDVNLNGTDFKAEVLGSFEFKYASDGTFEYVENGSVEKGNWKASEDGKSITLTYPDREVKQEVVQVSEQGLVVKYNDHGMQRQLTMTPQP